jgi:hypothetical protein
MNKIFLKPIVVLTISGISLVSSSHIPPSRRPFCGFSLKNGYYYQGKEQEYITREAKVGDKSGIPDVVEEIKSKIGIEVPIYVYIAKDEENCFATIGAGGKRVLIADHQFLAKVNKISGTNWAAISIIAHEIGHHIAGFSRRTTQLESELDADYWSGYALQKLGASKDASVKCIMTYGTENDTNSHPNKYSRSKTIKQGWEDASGGSYDNDRCESCN